ncbi:MAG: O-antigen ligase family protein [Sulfurifustis sp.]
MNPQSRAPWWRPAVASDGAGGWAQPPLATAPPPSAMPFRALLVFTFILLIAPQSIFPALAPLRIALIAAVLGVATYVVDCFIRRRPLVRFTPEMRIAACLLGWAVVTLPFSYWVGGSVSFLADVYLKTLIVFWLLGHVVTTVARLRTIAWALSLMAVPLALGGVENFLSGNFLHEGLPPDQARIVGYQAALTANPNDLALMLNLILPLTIALLLANRNPLVRAAALGIIGLDVIGIVITFSRAGFVTLAVTFATYLWVLRKRPERRWGYLVIVLALAAAPFLPSSYLERLSTITDVDSDPTGSSQARWSDTVAAAGYVAQHPLIGAGVGMDVLALNEVRGARWTEVHNAYLQYAVDLGIPGLILFLLLLRACLKSVGRVQRMAQASAAADLYWLAGGIRVSLIAFAVAAPFHPAGYHFYFYYIAGLAVAAGAIADRGARERADATPTPATPVRSWRAA